MVAPALGDRPGQRLDIVGSECAAEPLAPGLQGARDIGRDDGDVVHQRHPARRDGRVAVLDTVAELVEQARRAVDRGAALGVQLEIARRVAQHADAQVRRRRDASARANGSAGGGAEYGSPGIAPAGRRAAPRRRAPSASRTNSPEKPLQRSPSAGPNELRPRVGLSPTSPHMLAGMRIEPPPSLACAAGTMPAATAAAEPPLEPPALCVGFHGIARRRRTPPARWSATGRARACWCGRG